MDPLDLFLTLVLSVFALIVGIVSGYFFLFKSTEKRIEYEINSYELITESLSEKLSQTPVFKILSVEEPVTSLTSTIIKIENTGYNVIRPEEDISPEHPIRITAKTDKKLYYAQIIGQKGSDNNFDLITENNHTQLFFHHLNSGDGVKIRVFHSGKEDSDLEISGTVVGGPLISKKSDWKKDKGIKNGISFLSFTLVYFISVILIVLLPSNIMSSIGIGLFFLFLIILAIFLLTIGVRKLLFKCYDVISERIFNRTEW